MLRFGEKYGLEKNIVARERASVVHEGGGQNLERPIFRNFKITNIKITKDELFNIFITNLFFIP